MVKKKASGRRTRRTHNPAYKARVALAALREDRTLAQLCEQFEVHPNLVSEWEWERQLLERAAGVFDAGAWPEPVNLAPLHARIGQGAGERFFRRRAHQSGIAERKAMIDSDHEISITRQAELPKINRGTVYYLPRPVSPADLALMRSLDELHLEHPFMCARMLRDQLARQSIRAGRRHIRTLMLRMGIEALAPQPGTSRATPGNKVYPYLLRRLAICMIARPDPRHLPPRPCGRTSTRPCDWPSNGTGTGSDDLGAPASNWTCDGAADAIGTIRLAVTAATRLSQAFLIELGID